MSAPHQYSIKDHTLRCSHCNHEQFFRRSVHMDRDDLAGVLGARLEVHVYVCANCGGFQLFSDSASEETTVWEEMPSPSDLEESAEPIRCLDCGAQIAADQTECPSCGWTYRA